MRWLNPPYIIGQFCQIHFYLPDYYRIEFFLIFSVIRAEHHPYGRICTGLKHTGHAAEQIQMIRFMRRHRSVITQCDRPYDSVASLVSKFGRNHHVIVVRYGKIAAHLTIEETQTLLKYAGEGKLYARDARDGMVIHALNHKLDIWKTNELLREMDLPEFVLAG